MANPSEAAAFIAVMAVAMAAAQMYPQLPPQYQYQYQYVGHPQGPYYVAPVAPVVPVMPVHRQNITNSTRPIRGQDFVLGAPSPREKVLLHTTVYKKPGLWSSVATKEITFPPKGSRIRVNITRIHATDRARNGTGAFVKLTSGGIGQRNATLLFRSQRYQPINFELDIFGYPL